MSISDFFLPNRTRGQIQGRALSQYLPILLLLVLCGMFLIGGAQNSWAAQASQPEASYRSDSEALELVALDDEELAGVSAGDFSVKDIELTLNQDGQNFTVDLQNNRAERFSMDIAQSAFGSAQGVFTTLQTVNSVVDLSVVVNIVINGQTL